MKNEPCIDPPAQTITVGRVNGKPTFVKKLSEDQDWCNVVVWSARSNRVAFLVQDARLIVVDPDTGKVAEDRWLVSDDAYPPSHTVEGFALSPDGKTARIDPPNPRC